MRPNPRSSHQQGSIHMFFRSKREKGKDHSPPAPVSLASTAAAAAPAKAAPAAARPLAPEELKKRAEVRRRLAASLGDIVSLMIRSSRHKDRKLSELRWLVLPA